MPKYYGVEEYVRSQEKKAKRKKYMKEVSKKLKENLKDIKIDLTLPDSYKETNYKFKKVRSKIK